MGGPTIIITAGDKYGNLSVIKELPKLFLPSGQMNRLVLCKCFCGNLTKVRLLHLVRGRTLSCGCLNGEKSGDAGKPLYRTWRSMINRCLPSYIRPHNYYGKGITVCDEWIHSYLTFKKWALNNGYKLGLQIDRMDNTKGYYPDNCRFTTNMVNTNNRDCTTYVDYNGRKEAISLLARKLGKYNHLAAIRSRIKRGWNHEEAFNTEIRKGNYATSK